MRKLIALAFLFLCFSLHGGIDWEEWEAENPPAVTPISISDISIADIEAMPPEVVVAVIGKISAYELATIPPETIKALILRMQPFDIEAVTAEKVALLLTQIERKDIDEVLHKIAPSGIWRVKQKEFFEAWEKRDVSEMAEMVQAEKAKALPDFFTAWGNYQNFDRINWTRQEPLDFRQVLISRMDYDWEEVFKPDAPVILAIDFNIKSMEIQALQEVIRENRERISLVILPWASHYEYYKYAGAKDANNLTNTDTASYREFGVWGDKVFYAIKEVAPDMPIYLTVCYVETTMTHWVNAFRASYDGIALWNILTTRGNLNAVYRRVRQRFPQYENIILSGVMGNNPDKEGWLPFEEVKAEALQDERKVKDAGFSGFVIMTGHPDK